MDFSYSQQQLEIKRGIREWGKKHLTEEAIAAGYKNRGIAPEIAKAWVDDGWGMYGLPEEYGGKPVDHQTMAMIIEELNHCGGNIPMAPNLLIMFDMVDLIIAAPSSLCFFIILNSSSVSLPGLFNISSGIRILPIS